MIMPSSINMRFLISKGISALIDQSSRVGLCRIHIPRYPYKCTKMRVDILLINKDI